MSLKIRKSLVLIFIIALVLDIVTKLLIKEYVNYYETIPVIDGFFNIVHVLNPGAAFGFMRNMDDSYRQIFFVVLTSLAIIVIFYLTIKESRYLAAVSYTLILSGAVGNLIDRIHTGLVVDFLDFKLTPTYHWPSFNVADICITVGVTVLIIDAIFFAKKKS